MEDSRPSSPRPRRFSDQEAEELKWFFTEWDSIAGLRSSAGNVSIGAASAERRSEDSSRRCSACGGWPSDWKKVVAHRGKTPATCPECLGEGVPLQTVSFSHSKQGGKSLDAKTPAYAEPGKLPSLRRAAKVRRILARMAERAEDGPILVTVLWRFYGPRSPGDASIVFVDPSEGAKWFAPSEHPKPGEGKGEVRKVWGPAKVRVLDGKAEEVRGVGEEKSDGEARRYLAFRDLGGVVEYTAMVAASLTALAAKLALDYEKRFPDVPIGDLIGKARREVTRADGARRLATVGTKIEKVAALEEARVLLARACSAYRMAKRELKAESRG